jgi:large subunit ribosomal protein L2
MAIRIYHPTTPGRRKSSVNAHLELTKNFPPLKKLLVPVKRTAGRNAQGKITVRHRGGGSKRFYRIIDFRQARFDQPAKVIAIQYDPNRSAYLALIEYTDHQKAYILAPTDLTVGQTIISSPRRVDVKVGNRTRLENIPTGITVHNIELVPGKGGALVRSAGNGAVIMSIEGDYALLRLPSSELRQVLKNCFASIGQVSNIDHIKIRWGKAGRMRWRGIRPSVRGKAMNPVDHPHGGGEGNQPIGMPGPKTPWGKPARGVKTRRRVKYSNRLIVSRRRK